MAPKAAIVKRACYQPGTVTHDWLTFPCGSTVPPHDVTVYHLNNSGCQHERRDLDGAGAAALLAWFGGRASLAIQGQSGQPVLVTNREAALV